METEIKGPIVEGEARYKFTKFLHQVTNSHWRNNTIETKMMDRLSSSDQYAI